jgi:hypothetical protein
MGIGLRGLLSLVRGGGVGGLVTRRIHPKSEFMKELPFGHAFGPAMVMQFDRTRVEITTESRLVILTQDFTRS